MKFLCKIGLHRYPWSGNSDIDYCKRGCGVWRNNCHALIQ